jgi:hypothetical protein
MTPDQIKEVLRLHKLYVDGNAGGVRAYLRGADLDGAKNVPATHVLRTQIVPQDGAFRAFKKLANGRVAVIEIPEGAARVGGAVGRKCRASAALVLGFLKSKHEPDTDVIAAASCHDSDFMYRVGEVVEPTNGFNSDPFVECAPGIHFFLSYEEAAEYG